MRREEIGLLRLSHLHLKTSRLSIPATSISNARILKLASQQIVPFYEWVQPKRSSDWLFLSPRGSRNLGNVYQGLLQQLRAINSEVRHLQQIRQSVIAHWLKSHDVRKVQYMAGHKWVSSTERYQQTDLQDLQTDKYHPLQ